MKQRFSSLDVKVIAHELQQSLVTLRLSNVYDLSSRILLLKFSKPDNKKQIIIESGFRCHLTDYSRRTPAAPSAFVARLRQCLKTRRLTSVSQVGTDRILEFRFSDGQYRLFLEFFASGNVILTSAELNILAILRNVNEGEGQEPQRIGLKYSLENRQNFSGVPPLTRERIRDALKTAVQKDEERAAASAQSGTKKIQAKPGGELRRSLAVSIPELPPVVVEHILQANNFDATKKPADILDNEALLDELVKHMSEARGIVENITASTSCKGYVFAKKKPGLSSITLDEATSTQKMDDLLYDDFHPFIPHKLKEDPAIEVLQFEGYNRTIDEFFSSLEGQQLAARYLGRANAAKKKLSAVKEDQAKRIEDLQDAQAINLRKAAAIEANVERVQEAMDAVNGLLAQGMDWVDINKLVEREKKRQNPVAEIIKLPLKLSEKTITLTLAEAEELDDDKDEQENPFETDDSDSEDERAATTPDKDKQPGKSLTVDIFLDISPWSNAREYYEQRRSAAVKEEKTQLQAAQAVKSAESKITKDLQQGLKQEKELLQPIRQQMWFEKFRWFISSDGYLILSGKDANQCELLYKKLRKGDVYCSSVTEDGLGIVIKNNPKTPDAPIPPATLSQAGTFAVASSKAWDSKAGMGAWWVNADQLSKFGPAGEYLTSGQLLITGPKNFLPPGQLQLGLGIMFKISEESKAKHAKHRVYDEDPAIGAEAAGGPAERGPAPDQTGDLKAGVPEKVDNGDDLDGEPEDDGQDDEKRTNPLQAFDGSEQAADDVEEQMSEPNVTDQFAGEASAIEDAEETGQGEGETKEDKKEDDQEQEKWQEEKQEEKQEEEEEGVVDQEPSESVTEVSEALNRTSTPSSSKPGTPGPSKNGPTKRGQKGKAKKIAQKYRNQDEEDRAAAEAVIGATIGRQRAEAEAAARAQRQADLEALKERRQAHEQRKLKEAMEEERMRRAMMEEEGVDAADADEGEKLSAVNALVGTPLPGDEIVEAIALCAPWNALGQFKYKVKLQPGSVKKSKAVKEILERWKADASRKGSVDETARDPERMWPREVELIKTLRSEEVFQCVPAKQVKVVVAGGASGGGGGQKGQGKGGKGGGKGSKK